MSTSVAGSRLPPADQRHDVGAAGERERIAGGRQLDRLVERRRAACRSRSCGSTLEPRGTGAGERRLAQRSPSAAATAFATAAAVGMIGGSPSPFTPIVERCGSGSSSELDDDLGRVGHRQELVVLEVRR